ncbi:hypothetical protein ACFX13_027826 [Malus domestica]
MLGLTLRLLRVKLGYVNHLFGWPSNFEFFGKDFETFSISPEDLVAFTFEASIGEVVGDDGVYAKAVGGETLDGAVAESVATIEGVATE